MRYSAVDRNYYDAIKYEIRIVDRVGGGDAFAGGLILALLTKSNIKDILEHANEGSNYC